MKRGWRHMPARVRLAALALLAIGVGTIWQSWREGHEGAELGWLATLVGVTVVVVANMVIFRWSKAMRRLDAGLCLHCGYDLRATPDRCPECGHSADKPGVP